MTPTPLVSIIIPVYNSENYIAETISSAIDQTWSNKEIIVIDDGSIDRSLEIAERFESANLKVLSQKNSGASAARNRGLRESTGDFIQFLDADDLLMPDKIEKQVTQLGNNSEKLSISPVIHFNRFSGNISSLKPTEKELALYNDNHDPFRFLLNLYDISSGQAAIVPIHSWLTPVGLMKSTKWNENLTINDDGEFFCRVALSSTGILAAKDTFCYYRKYVNENRVSLSGRKDLKALESHYNSLLLIRDHLIKTRNDARIDRVIADNLMTLLMQSYPEYKILTGKIEKRLRELGGSTHSPILGGKIIESIKSSFGWKATRLLQYYFYKMFKSNAKY